MRTEQKTAIDRTTHSRAWTIMDALCWSHISSVGHGYPAALAMVAVTIGLVLPFRALLAAPTIMLLCVPVIVMIARLFGASVSATAAVVTSLALDLLFVPPYYHVNIAEPAEWIALVVFLAVALISGQQTGRLREREHAALRRQRQLELLNRMTVQIALEDSALVTAEFIAGALAGTLGVSRVALYTLDNDTGTLAIAACAGTPDATEAEIARANWVVEHTAPLGLHVTQDGSVAAGSFSSPSSPTSADAVSPADGIYLPLQTSDTTEGVLCIPQAEPQLLGPEELELLLSAANLAAASLRRQRLEDANARATAQQEADRLRGTFFSSVSHELKTPLAAATARVTGLLDEGPGRSRDRTQEELAEVAEDLGRLNSLIGDLLDFSRLESHAWRPELEPTEMSDILGTLLSRLPLRDRSRIHFSVPADLPPVMADYTQLVRAFSNIVENALAYSPEDSHISVSAAAEEGELTVAIEDHGPGIAPTEMNAIFEKFYRGAAAAAVPSGTGLGLAISYEIVRNHSGRVWAEPVSPSGARFVVALPIAKEPSA